VSWACCAAFSALSSATGRDGEYLPVGMGGGVCWTGLRALSLEARTLLPPALPRRMGMDWWI
jgi:hypothetical protein